MGAPLTLEANRVRVTPRNAGGTSHAVPLRCSRRDYQPKGEVRMKSKRLTTILAVISLAVALPISLAAQNNVKQNRPHQYHHYQLVDPGTFGGPQSWTFTPEWARSGFLNDQGTFAASADTSAVDPTCSWSPGDCFATAGFQWQNGVTQSWCTARRHRQPGQLDQCERADGGNLRQRPAGSTEPGASANTRRAMGSRANDRSGDLAWRCG